jgi:hypothetical protein
MPPETADERRARLKAMREDAANAGGGGGDGGGDGPVIAFRNYVPKDGALVQDKVRTAAARRAMWFERARECASVCACRRGVRSRGLTSNVRARARHRFPRRRRRRLRLQRWTRRRY